jgi:hypothetical protein
MPQVDGMDDYIIYSLLDTLLERHRQVTQIHQPRSMMIHAEEIVRNADENIQKWMELNKIRNENLE